MSYRICDKCHKETEGFSINKHEVDTDTELEFFLCRYCQDKLNGWVKEDFLKLKD